MTKQEFIAAYVLAAAGRYHNYSHLPSYYGEYFVREAVAAWDKIQETLTGD